VDLFLKLGVRDVLESVVDFGSKHMIIRIGLTRLFNHVVKIMELKVLKFIGLRICGGYGLNSPVQCCDEQIPSPLKVKIPQPCLRAIEHFICQIYEMHVWLMKDQSTNEQLLLVRFETLLTH
jgi:hypothetical protein